MKPADHYQEDLASIRKMMEQSSKFLSLSGLSGILAGTYALLGYRTPKDVFEKEILKACG
jgi:hypothetical protein